MFRFSIRPLYLLVVALLSFVAPTLDTVEAQQGALAVVSTIPTSNELTASVVTAIWINFPEPIDPSSVTFGSCWAIGRWSGLQKGHWRWSVADPPFGSLPTIHFLPVSR